jgi:hypothetical protein
MLEQDARIRPRSSRSIDGNWDLIGTTVIGSLLDYDLMVAGHW